MRFRPTLRLPRIVPLIGAVGCLFAMFIINPTFGLMAVGIVVGLYLWVVWQAKTPRTGTVRSGIFAAFAEWAAAKVIEHDLGARRAWQPSLVMPVEDPARVRGEFSLLLDLCRPEGSIKFLGLATRDTVTELEPKFAQLCSSFRNNRVMATSSIIDSAGFREGTITGLQALGSAFFRPNILVLNLPEHQERYPEFAGLVQEATRLEIGTMLLGLHRQAGLGMAKAVNIWTSPRADLRDLRDLARIDRATDLVLVGPFVETVPRAPLADMDIMGLRKGPDLAFVAEMVHATRSSCLFAADSGWESAIA